jgi:hypothetical protein
VSAGNKWGGAGQLICFVEPTTRRLATAPTKGGQFFVLPGRSSCQTVSAGISGVVLVNHPFH